MLATVADINEWTATIAMQPATQSDEWLSAVQRLAEVCEGLLQQSRLLNLPSDVLLRVMRHLDAKALARLATSSRAFHKGTPSTLMDRACDEAAEWQHGSALAALRPQRLTAARRLRSLEEAIAYAPDWARDTTSSVQSGHTFLWPSYELANADIGGFHLAVVMSASASGALKRVEEEAVENADPTQPDWAHKAAINLTARLAAPDALLGGIKPASRSSAVDFLAQELCRTGNTAGNDTYTHRVAEGLCYANWIGQQRDGVPLLSSDHTELIARLKRALWLRSRSKLGEQAAQRDQTTILLGLEQLESAQSMQSESAETEELLRWLYGAMKLQPGEWPSATLHDHVQPYLTRVASNGARVEVKKQGIQDIRSALVSLLCACGQASHALASIALPVAQGFLRDLQSSHNASAVWQRMYRHVTKDLCSITRAIQEHESDRDDYENVLRMVIRLMLEGQRIRKENEEPGVEVLPLEGDLTYFRAALAELLRVRGRVEEAEQLQRVLVDRCSAQLEHARERLEARRVQLMCFGLRWVKCKEKPEQGRMLANESLVEALSSSRDEGYNDRTRFLDRSTFDGLGLPYALEELPQDTYVEVGDAYWEPQVVKTEDALSDNLHGRMEHVKRAFRTYQNSIAGGVTRLESDPLSSNRFTEEQGLHTMLVSRGKHEEASELLERLALAYFEVRPAAQHPPNRSAPSHLRTTRVCMRTGDIWYMARAS